MRISDWSSDVCSSDLIKPDAGLPFSNELNSHPAVTVLKVGREAFRHSARADLRNDPVKIDEAQRDADEAANLTDPIALSFDKAEARNRFLGKLHANRGPADVFDRAQVRRVPVHAVDLLVPRVPAPNTASRKLPKSRQIGRATVCTPFTN